ncbi:MAG: TonB-dependent receptor [Bacteroidota bacterium]
MKYLFILVVWIPINAYAQTTLTLSGRITDTNGESVTFANVGLVNEKKFTAADTDGEFLFEQLAPKQYRITVSAIGYKKYTQAVYLDQNLFLDIMLQDSVEQLESIVVRGKTESNIQREKPITITSIGAQQVSDQALGAEELLKTSTGVVVRQNGGLGSNVNINLNGLTGQAVRLFYDGIPVEVFGGGLQLNTIPVDALERVDVYKGVMPVDIGIDALGGGINLVPQYRTDDVLQTSYTFGSFNTHRVTAVGNRNLSDHFAISTLSFFNYSDNDYTMRNVRNLTERTLSNGSVVAGPEQIIDARRFHDRHISAYGEIGIKFRDIAWADRLDVVTTIAHRNDQLQNGVRLSNTAVGEATSLFTTISQRVDYRKTLFNDKLSLRYYGILAFTNSEVDDNTTNFYSWRGELYQRQNESGSELFTNRTERNGDDLGTAHRVVGKWALSNNTDLTVSNFIRYNSIQGNDPVGPRITINGEEVDPNTVASTITRNVAGAELTSRFLDDKLTAITFYKRYYYNAEAIDVVRTNATQLPVRRVDSNEDGYGVALKFQAFPTVFIRSSFERTARIPNEIEIFGDFGGTIPNYEIQPELGNNLNIGINYSRFLDNETELFFSLDGFIRDLENLIVPRPFGQESIIFRNAGRTYAQGLEFSSRFSPIRRLNVTGNLTYQTNEFNESGNQVPNQPILLGNIGGRYQLEDVFGTVNNLILTWTYFFIDEFSINEVPDLDRADPQFVVPTQHLHNAGIIYRIPQRNMNLSFNVQNVFNSEIFDNFRVPRPGINYQFKISYTL